MHWPTGRCSSTLRREYTVHSVGRAADVEKLTAEHRPDVLVCEQQLEDARGVDLLQRMRVAQPHAVRVLALRSTHREEMVRAINDAAVYQVISQPFEPEQLALVLKRALESRELSRIHRYLSRELKFADAVIRHENDSMTRTLQETYHFDKLVFISDKMAEVCNMARKAAATDLPVLIEGETGTGKELLAKAIHLFSDRHKAAGSWHRTAARSPTTCCCPSCSDTSAARSPARSATGSDCSSRPTTARCSSTRSPTSRPRCRSACCGFCRTARSRAIGSDRPKPTNVRIIAASNRPIRQLVEEGKFRRDLYYRLKGFEIPIPPLRERPEDIPVLTDFLIKKYSEVFSPQDPRRRQPGPAEAALVCVSRQRARTGKRDPTHRGHGRGTANSSPCSTCPPRSRAPGRAPTAARRRRSRWTARR